MGHIVLVYDADCGFCRVSLALLLAWDRGARLRPVAVQSEEADGLLAGMPGERRMASWHLVTEDGGVRSGGAAFPALLRELPGGALPAALSARFPQLSERAYDWVAAHRSAIGRLVPGPTRRWADSSIKRRTRGQESSPPGR